jgi:uncharacterized phosphosugar-binding protein
VSGTFPSFAWGSLRRGGHFPDMENLGSYLAAARSIVERILATQARSILQAAEISTDSIAAGGWVHCFGTGHSRMAVEEMFPRIGSLVGFHPMAELSLTFYHNVVGANGLRQALYLERVEGLAEVILKSFRFGPRDSFIVVSSTGINAVPIEVALGAKARGMKVMAITSVAHARATDSRHPSGKRLFEIADVVLDNCTPPGDALVTLEGVRYPVGPGSTIGAVAIMNALKCQVAENLAARGIQPDVLPSPHIVGDERAAEEFERVLQAYHDRAQKL